MARTRGNPLRELNVPWITEDGHIDMKKLPIDGTLIQSVSDGDDDFSSACRVLSSMVSAGRTEAGVFLCGLLGFYADNAARKQEIVSALWHVKTRQAADLLFSELERTESSNSTRGYINEILKALKGFPLDLVKEGFEVLLSSGKWSCRMKRKFRDILDEIEYRNLRSTDRFI